MAKVKAPAITFNVPQNRQDVVYAIADIGNLQRNREKLKTEMDDAISAIQEKYAEALADHNTEILKLTSGVHIWCEANRADLTNKEKVKTADFTTGVIKWRMRPPSCKVIKVKEAMEEIKNAKLLQFLREKPEINKEAILANPEAVKDFRWLKLEQVEDFVIVPFETNIEEIA